MLQYTCTIIFYLQQHNINDNIFMKNFTLKKAIKVFATKKKK